MEFALVTRLHAFSRLSYDAKLPNEAKLGPTDQGATTRLSSRRTISVRLMARSGRSEGRP